MALVNQAKREINAKVVFFGPGLSGKATNLKHVYNKLKPEFRGAMKAMNVQDARMLFFDFTPPGDGKVDGFTVRFHVYTVSGRAVDPAAWKMVLKGVDGIVFVADASPQRQAENRESLENLDAYLKGYGQSASSVPMVLQFNKSDLPDALGVADLERMLNAARLPSYKASSITGEGVLQTLLGLVKTVLTGLRDKGLAGIASGEGLQRMVEAPPAASTAPPVQPATASRPEVPEPPPAAPAPKAAAPEARSTEFSAPEIQAPEIQAPEIQAPEIQAPEIQAPEIQAPEIQAPEEPLFLEISGAPQSAGSGLFRLPLTIRSGARTKSVLLTLALSLEEG